MFNLPPNSLVAMAVVLGLLSLATGIVLALTKRNQQRSPELMLRIKSWWWMVAIVFIALVVNQLTAIVLFGVISFLAFREFLSIIPTRQTDRRVIFWAYLTIPVQYLWVVMEWYGMFMVFIPVYVFLFLPTRMTLTGDTQGFIRSAGVMHWAVMLTVYFISHIAYLLVLEEKNLDAGAMGLVLFLIITTELNDVSQFFWGKLFGRQKIAPQVSPNKTWQGFIGGVVTTTLVAALCGPYLTFLDWRFAAPVGLLIAVSGFFGDLVISSVKRDLHIKDSGKLIPGHGGILDRLDSLLFTAPLFFHVIYFLESRV